MQVAIASGKGGTGKTTVATNLAYVAACDNRSVTYLDCDVEEPNGHVFLRPAISHHEPVAAAVPRTVRNPKLCNHCGDCGEICQFSAIVCLGNKVLTFPQLCHSCGGCGLFRMPRWTLSARLAKKSASSRWVEAARSVSPRALLQHRRGHEPAGDLRERSRRRRPKRR